MAAFEIERQAAADLEVVGAVMDHVITRGVPDHEPGKERPDQVSGPGLHTQDQGEQVEDNDSR